MTTRDHTWPHVQTLFETFGNAATTNNQNSSRFGKFTKLLFDREGRVRGGNVEIYLLEKSRLVLQNPGDARVRTV